MLSRLIGSKNSSLSKISNNLADTVKMKRKIKETIGIAGGILFP